MKSSPDGLSQPFFSIIIPTYNRPHRLADCLRSLTQLDYPRDRYEVIVVDDGSQTSMEPIVIPFANSLDLHLMPQTNAGPASARNAGALNAKGQFLVFTDDDCRPAPTWLTALARHFAETPNSLLGGRTLNALSKNPFSIASQILIDYLYDYFHGAAKPTQFFTSNNMAVSKALFQELGGFDTTFSLAAGEDRELCDRWRHQGYSMHYVPNAVVYHYHALSLGSFWRQHFNYGRGAFHFHQLRAERAATSIKVEPLSFYLKLLAYPLITLTPLMGILVAGLVFISQVANSIGFLTSKIVES